MEKTTYEGNELEVEMNSGAWIYDGVEHEKVLKMNPELHAAICIFVEDYVANFEAIKKKEREEARVKRVAERAAEIAEFKKSFEAEHGDKFKEVELSYANPEGIGYNAKFVKFGNTGFRIEYNENVYGTGYYSSKTKLSWAVQDSDYKTRRYAKLETAVNKIVERIVEQEEEREQKIVASNETERKENLMKEFAEKLGLVYKKETKYHSGNYGRSGYDTTHYRAIKGNVRVVLEWDYSNKCVKSGTCTLTKEDASQTLIAEMVRLDEKLN